MLSRASAFILVAVLMAPSQAQRPAPSGTITIDAASRGPAVPPDLYGVFFEEISHAGEGGLYAELIQNRGFEDSRLPPMCKLENGFLIPPRTAHFDTGKPSDFKLRWNVTSETPAWTLNATGDAAATMNLVDEMPLTPATPRSLRVDVTALPTGGRAALNNEGFWGIQRRQGRCWSYIPETGGGDFTVSLKARKISGREGFIIPLGLADGRRVQWNVGGWGNRQHAVQVADAVVGEQTPGTIETGRWYDLKMEVTGRTIRGYIDGVLVQERTLARIDRVLAISGRDEKTGDIIIKVVNSAPELETVTMQVNGATLAAGGNVTVLTSDHPLDENTFEQPEKIVPRTTPLQVGANSFAHSLPPHSLSIIRLPTRR